MPMVQQISRSAGANGKTWGHRRQCVFGAGFIGKPQFQHPVGTVAEHLFHCIEQGIQWHLKGSDRGRRIMR